MIVSDKPPYDITPGILRLVASVSEKIGQVNANKLTRPSPQLRKQNRIRTIHASLKIEGNTLSQDQITALIENKRVVGPKKDIMEVLNAIAVYDHIAEFDPFSSLSFLKAHKMLMEGLISHPGRYRREGVGIIQGKGMAHIAPPASNVPTLMNTLFRFLKNADELILIKSCVFHYEMEFIHPFPDGNGRMGRLWQSVILRQWHPVFDFLPFETLIGETQKEYYAALATSDREGKSTAFINYILGVIDSALDEVLYFKSKIWTEGERLEYFVTLGKKVFSRKDYMHVFKNISSATASRDLQKGIALRLFRKTGERNKTRYTLR